MSMFEKAVRQKLRWTHKGSLTVEDLWDLNLKELDTMYGTMLKQKEAANGVSLLSTTTAADEQLDLKIAIVKHVVMTKLDEKALRDAAANRSAQKQKLLEIIEKKQEAALHDMPIEKLREMVNGL